VSSHDYLQLTTILHRLQQLSTLANPVSLVEEIVSLVHTAISACADEPKGDPDKLDSAATAFTTMGGRCTTLAADVRTHANDKIPKAWTGDTGAKASDAVNAVADQIDLAPDAFAELATALRKHAGNLRDAKAKHSSSYEKLSGAAGHLIAHQRIPFTHVEIPIGPNPAGIPAAIGDAISGLSGCIGAYQDEESTCHTVASTLRDVAGQARMSYVDISSGWISSVDAAVLADQMNGSGEWDGGILSDAQLQRATAQLAKLSPADQKKLITLMRNAKSDTERAYILKAFAAGHPVSDVTKFAGLIHGKDAAWLNQHLSLDATTDANGFLVYTDANGNQAPVQQKDETTCGSTSVLMVRAMADPAYALWLTTGNKPNDPNATSQAAFAKRLADDEQHIHDTSTQGQLPGMPRTPWNDPNQWPEAGGTPPWGATKALNEYQHATGKSYGWHVVDDTDGSNVDGALSSVERSVDGGTPVPIYVGDGIPRHVVVVVGHKGDQLQIYEPSAGKITTVSESDFRDGHMDNAGGWQHVDFVLTPNG
jgi:hypothetical protein